MNQQFIVITTMTETHVATEIWLASSARVEQLRAELGTPDTRTLLPIEAGEEMINDPRFLGLS